jgi:muconolactone D-isomerase
MEFLTDMVTTVPEGTADSTVEDTRAREAKRAGELAREGHLIRLWKPPAEPGVWRTLGLFSADDEDHLQQLLASLPLHVWMTVGVTPLTPHPSDPACAPHSPAPHSPAPHSAVLHSKRVSTS